MEPGDGSILSAADLKAVRDKKAEIDDLKANTAEVFFAPGCAHDAVGWSDEDVIHHEDVDGRTRRVVRSSVDEARRRTSDHPGTEVRALDLEEIFIAHLRGAGYRGHQGTLHENALANSSV